MTWFLVAYINPYGTRVCTEVLAYTECHAVYVASCGQYPCGLDGKAEALPLL